ncbi:SufB/SufD family protein [Hyphobacterium sp.]|uniref:SufB/SufD family protein n=1 Tax=Hyphobacterium sp. TaxID=2004662 RepID=UPI003BA9F911
MFKPNSGESLLISLLEGKTGWRKDLRGQLLANGLPNKRSEAWKWSDLRAAARNVTREHSVQLQSDVRPQWAEIDFKLDDTFSPGALAHGIATQTAIYRFHLGGVHNLDLGSGAGLSAASIIVSVASNVKCTVLERYRSAEEAFAISAVDYQLDPGAEVNRIVLTDDVTDTAWLLSSSISLSPDSTFSQTSLTFGSRFFRQETRVSHPGQGASATLNAAYLAGPERHADFSTIVKMTGPGGKLRQLTKGIAHGGGRGVFQGKIHVEQAAQQTDAEMTHKGILIDERSEIDAKPELEIYADDVVCSHGNAIGTLDEMAMFYMRQRGLPEADARRLLLESFLDETLDAVAHEKTKDTLQSRISNRLKGLL